MFFCISLDDLYKNRVYVLLLGEAVENFLKEFFAASLKNLTEAQFYYEKQNLFLGCSGNQAASKACKLYDQFLRSFVENKLRKKLKKTKNYGINNNSFYFRVSSYNART